MKKKFTGIILGLTFCGSAISAGSANFNVTSVGCLSRGTCYVNIQPATNLTTCSKKGQIRFDITLPGSKAQYSAALAALMSGKQINAYLTDTCINGFPTPDWLQVQN